MRQAVERNFEIIGEAVKRLAQTDPACADGIGQYPQIIAFRNILIQGDDLVDNALVWSTVQTQLPALLRDVQALLASNPQVLARQAARAGKQAVGHIGNSTAHLIGDNLQRRRHWLT